MYAWGVGLALSVSKKIMLKRACQEDVSSYQLSGENRNGGILTQTKVPGRKRVVTTATLFMADVSRCASHAISEVSRLKSCVWLLVSVCDQATWWFIN